MLCQPPNGTLARFSAAPLCRLHDRMPCQPSSSGRQHPPSPICRATAPAIEENAAATGGRNFIRPHLQDMEPYTPILPFEILSKKLGMDPHEIVKLDANENPYGPPPEVLKALGSMQFPNIYPDPETRRLRAALSELNNVPMENLLVSTTSFLRQLLLTLSLPIMNATLSVSSHNERVSAHAGCSLGFVHN